MSDLEDLAARVESASADEQREMLEDAFAAVFPQPLLEDEPEWQGPGTPREPHYHQWHVRELTFCRKLDAEAFESAALMLVPRDWFVDSITEYNQKVWSCTLRGPWPTPTNIREYAIAHPRGGVATSALAITAASLRALAKEVG